MPVTILYTLVPAPEKAALLVELVQRVAAESRSNPDCLALRVFRSEGAPAPLVVFEQWSSADAHRAAFESFSGDLADALMAALDGPLEPLYLDELPPVPEAAVESATGA